MLTSIESGWRSASSAAVWGVRSVPVVKTVTEKSRERACAMIERKSRRMKTSPPERVRKKVPASASSSDTRLISSNPRALPHLAGDLQEAPHLRGRRAREEHARQELPPRSDGGERRERGRLRLSETIQ